ncbi:unnamed protein product [Paramecium sonneborni]|uniref:Uncharacterized protein n=1 Tax=Paramecium sonneborni TaxID=65129 RepID=A0A8S1KBA9_9CILI|nr:unnamed protein product [Paramecium sonneborni]
MLINCQENDLQILVFSVFRKHFFRDQSYYLKLSHTQIMMSQECQFMKTKYILDLNSETQFEWIVRNQQLVGFLFPYQNKMKDFYGDSKNLSELKQRLGKQIIFKSLTIQGRLDKFNYNKTIQLVNQLLLKHQLIQLNLHNIKLRMKQRFLEH